VTVTPRAVFYYVGIEGQWDREFYRLETGKWKIREKTVFIGVGNVWNAERWQVEIESGSALFSDFLPFFVV
jgi:hypothetical protein